MQHLTFPALVLAVSLVGTQVHADTSLPEPLEVGPDTATIDLSAQRAAIGKLESDAGSYAPALQEQLLSLGLGLQQSGLHREAIKVFKRATHLARINNGLHNREQILLLQREIASHMALKQYVAVDERQQYLFRVQLSSLKDNESRSEALIQQAQWQFNAYRLGFQDANFERLMATWELYRLALNEIIDQSGHTSKQLRLPLLGMLRAQYLISAFEVNSQPSGDGFGEHPRLNRFYSYRSQSYKNGRTVVQALYDVEKATHGSKSPEAIQTFVMLGDWNLWNGYYGAAVSAYKRAIAELVARDGAQEQVTAEFSSLFGAPRALPDIDGIRRAPKPVDAANGELQLSFSVSAKGRVGGLQRTDKNTLDRSHVIRLMRSLRKTIFRPRFELAEPVDTDKIVWTYDLQ